MSRPYNPEIAETVDDFLRGDDWRYKFDEEDGEFTFGVATGSRLGTVRFRIVIQENAYLVLAYCPLSADKDNMAAVAEYLTRANYGLLRGNFEMDYRDGEVRYKCFVDCADTLISAAVVRGSIYAPVQMYRRYGSGLAEVMFGFSTPEDAVAKAEGGS